MAIEKTLLTDRQVVVFSLGTGEYGIPIRSVQEINRLAVASRLPRSPEFITGVIDMRGRIVPVIDLHKRLGLPPSVPSELSRTIVAEVNGELLGLSVDAVTEVVSLQEAELAPVPQQIARDADHISCIGKLSGRLIAVLAMDRLFSKAEMDSLKDMDDIDG